LYHGRYGVLIHDSYPDERWFSFMMASAAAMASGVTTRCAWHGQGESVTELMPFRNFLLHSYTCCSDRHASPYWTSIRWWISMSFTISPRKKRTTSLFLFGACCKWGRQFYTPASSCCVPPSYCHSSNHEFHCCQITGQSSSVSNLYHTFKVFMWLWLIPYDSFPNYHSFQDEKLLVVSLWSLVIYMCF